MFRLSEFPALSTVNQFLSDHQLKTDELTLNLQRIRFFGPNFWRLTYTDAFPISDLGLRRSSQPLLYLKKCFSYSDNRDILKNLYKRTEKFDRANMNLFKFAGTSLNDSLDGDLTDFSNISDIPSDVASQILCYYVNILGSWEDAYKMSAILYNRVSTYENSDRTAYLITNIANINAIHIDNASREMYRAAYNMWSSTYEKFSTLLRIATSEIKRFGDFVKADEALDFAEEFAKQCGSDEPLYLGMIYNLRALRFMKTGMMDKSMSASQRAYSLAREAKMEHISIAQTVAGRYIIQITLNLGLIHYNAGNWSKAHHYFSEAQAMSINYNSDSFVECSMLRAQALSRVGRTAESIPDLEKSLILCQKAAYPRQETQVMKLLAIAYHDTGQLSECRHLLDQIRQLNNKIESL